jgi:hypothetical protein
VRDVNVARGIRHCRLLGEAAITAVRYRQLAGSWTRSASQRLQRLIAAPRPGAPTARPGRSETRCRQASEGPMRGGVKSPRAAWTRRRKRPETAAAARAMVPPRARRLPPAPAPRRPGRWGSTTSPSYTRRVTRAPATIAGRVHFNSLWPGKMRCRPYDARDGAVGIGRVCACR